MINIDKKDRKILFYLLQDSRQTLKSIGKKTGISKELASYRIKRLMNKNVITKFPTNVYFSKMGYSYTDVFFQFKNINPKIKSEIVNFIINSPHTSYVSLLEGKYDFQFEILLGDPHECEAFYDELKRKYNYYLTTIDWITWIRGEHYNYPFLMDDEKNITKPFIWHWGTLIPSEIDELDYFILKELADDARKQTKKIADDVNSRVSVVSNRINKLIKTGVIMQFTINVDWSKLGFNWYHLQIYLNDYNKKSQILNFIRKSPYLIRIFKGLYLNFDIHCTFLFQQQKQLRSLIEEITERFPNEIANYQFYRTFKILKHEYMVPKLLKLKNPLLKTK
jgi:DNA-binding Lrp family transcriptional regulator